MSYARTRTAAARAEVGRDPAKMAGALAEIEALLVSVEAPDDPTPPQLPPMLCNKVKRHNARAYAYAMLDHIVLAMSRPARSATSRSRRHRMLKGGRGRQRSYRRQGDRGSRSAEAPEAGPLARNVLARSYQTPAAQPAQIRKSAQTARNRRPKAMSAPLPEISSWRVNEVRTVSRLFDTPNAELRAANAAGSNLLSTNIRG